MKATILQGHLLTGLQKAGRGISAKAQLPVLQNLLLVAGKTDVTVIAMNMEMTIRHTVLGKVEQDGNVCVPARLVTEFVSSLPDEPVELETTDEGLRVACGGYLAVIPTVPAEEYPPVPESEHKKLQELRKEDITAALLSVVFSAATDDSRPTLTGVKITSKDDETVFAATDGYRLSVKRTGRIFESPIDRIIPARALSEVVRLALDDKTRETLNLGQTTDGQPAFIVGDTTVITRAIDGDYVPFERIIPKTHTTRCVFRKDELVRAIKSVALFAKDTANIVKLHVDPQGVDVLANTPTVGKGSVRLDVPVEGEGGDIAFNSRFLTDFLGNYPQETVAFEMTGSLNAGVLRPEDDPSYLHIIMPVRVQS